MRKRATSVMMSNAATTDHCALVDGHSLSKIRHDLGASQRKATRNMDMKPITQHPPKMLHATIWCMRSAAIRLNSRTTQISPV